MASRSLIFLLLTVFLGFQFSVAQDDVQSPTLTITGTTVLTVPLQSYYTSLSQATATFETQTTENGVVQTVTATYDLYGGIQADSVSVGTGYVISNFSDNQYAYCWFPTSGNWARLPRILFYLTIVFALVARNHEWLVAGALAASLTFSGVAAIQIALQTWSRQLVAELDLFPILGILSTSCLIAVPLMNWSSTIRYLGLSKEEKHAKMAAYNKRGKEHYEAHPSERNKPSDSSPTRTVIIFWALLVAVGFLSAFVALVDLRDETKEYVSLYTVAGVDTVHCVPPGGQLNLTAGQYDEWWNFWFNEEFMTVNNCEDPCKALPQGQKTLFRSNDDLKILSAKSIDNVLEGTRVSGREQRALRFTQVYFQVLLFGLPVILLQGFMHVILFRKYTPQQARHYIYVKIVKAHDQDFVPGLLRRAAAFTLAITFYLLALLVLVISPFALVLNVCATEIFLYIIPQSEGNDHVGQWGVFAGTGLVFVAAFICRFQPGVKHYFDRATRQTRKAAKHKMKHLQDHSADDARLVESGPRKFRRKSSYRPDKTLFRDIGHSIALVFLDAFDSIWYWTRNFFGMFGHEWNLFVTFWKDPRKEPKLRKRPESPVARVRRNRKASNMDALPKATQMTNIKSPQFSNYQYPKGGHYTEIKDEGIETRIHPTTSGADLERPLLAYAPSNATHLANRPGRSAALQQTPEKREPTTSPPPLGLRNVSHPRKPVPGASAQAVQEDEIHHHDSSHIDSHLSPPTAGTLAHHSSSTDSSRVMASLSDSIADRSRRSNIYSPEPGEDYIIPPSPEGTQLSPRSHPNAPPPPPQAHSLTSARSIEGLIPVSSEDDTVPPLPPPKNFVSTIGGAHSSATATGGGLTSLPQLSRRSSNLFSEDELARLYKNGTPQIRSMMPSRNSISAPSGPSSTGGSGGLMQDSSQSQRDLQVPGKVSYLQIQTGSTEGGFDTEENWGDEVVLRKDRYGRWVVVDVAAERERERERESSRNGSGTARGVGRNNEHVVREEDEEGRW